MSNGRRDWWNIGRKPQGLKSSTAFDNLERVLGLAGGLADRVKSRREDRGNALQRNMALIVGQNGKNYKRLIDSGDISALKQQFESLGEKVKRSDADTMGIYDFYIKDMEKQMLDVESYKNDKIEIESLEADFAKEVNTYIDNQAGYSDEHRASLAKELDEKLKYYIEKKERFFNYFPDRTASDPNLLNAMTSVENYGNYIISDILHSDTGYIDKFEAEMFRVGLRDGNLEAYNSYHDKKNIAVATGAKSYQASITQNIAEGNKQKVLWDGLYPKPDASFEDQVNAYNLAPPDIKKKLGVNEKFETTFSDYKNEGGKMNMQDYFESLKETRKAQHQSYFDKAKYDNEQHIRLTSNSFIHSLPGAEEAVDIEAIKGAPPTDMRNMVFEHYLSSYQTKNYPQLKSIVGDGNINGMKDLHDAVLSAYDSATSVSLKNAIRGQWNKFYNELDRKVRKKGDSTFPDASSLFRTNINTIK